MAKELQDIFVALEKCIELRSEYMHASRQCPGDNPKDSHDWDIYPAPPKPSYPVKVDDSGNDIPNKNEEFEMSAVFIPGPDESLTYHQTSECIYQIFDKVEFQQHSENPSSKPPPSALVDVPSLKKYYQDQDFILSIVSDGPAKSFAFRRLRYLESKFQMYLMLNEYQEMADSKSVPHRDFYNVRKVCFHSCLSS